MTGVYSLEHKISEHVLSGESLKTVRYNSKWAGALIGGKLFLYHYGSNIARQNIERDIPDLSEGFTGSVSDVQGINKMLSATKSRFHFTSKGGFQKIGV